MAQCAAAVGWTWRTLRAPLVLAGHSAGGHLAAAMLQRRWREAAGVPARALAGALPVSGVFRLRPLRQMYVQDWLRLASDAEADALSPAHDARDQFAELTPGAVPALRAGSAADLPQPLHGPGHPRANCCRVGSLQ